MRSSDLGAVEHADVRPGCELVDQIRDMLFSSVSPRWTIVTLRACVEKNMAAWPAEWPAPMMWMSRPWVWSTV